jgi:RNA-binding protein
MDKQFKKQLKAKCHHLDPVVRMGANGLTDAVHGEIHTALNAHELIKVKLVGDKEERKALAQAIAEKHHAEIIQEIGHLVCLYRKNNED